jgi:CheY-like chemotaxis protein
MINSIVLAEDNLEHCFFFKKALKEIAPSIQIAEVHDGDKLIELLESYLPDLLFLDLAMPCKDGVQCIKEIRADRLYDRLPIVVFTMSSQDNAIQTAYGFGANLYIVKPNEYSKLVQSLNSILSMDWTNPKLITEKFFRGNRYIPFMYNS